ncbi:CsbD family protein [Methylobacterium sp. E-041]|uniref:CsbD family protein n=1 Tax=unclassified Methylobacterium TaxID=2615210 RepID=UPI0011CCD4A5|nr:MULTISPECIES: CsbD family protein [unclassified Methylobacterium]MCJ2041921.1 CsbD family protein [Methylobacterium sp. J-059]MCJ2105175.1 CsbD family protein [Methylobacterium sp. E-041]TXN65287.1 CsbD family protein [Methylobacterium sp. WL6]
MSAQKSSEASEKIKGSVKEAIGKLIGDEKAETEGKAQQKLPSDAVKPNVGPKT